MGKFDVLDKSYRNVDDRLTIAKDALNKIWNGPMPITENEKRMWEIAFNAVLKINELLVKSIQD
jgi:hypothetical protein